LPDRVADVAGEVVDGAPAPDVAALFPDQRGVPERAARRSRCRIAREARSHQLFAFFLEVQLDLLGQVAVHAPAREQIPDRAKRVHGFTGASTSLIPSSIFS
jgi:hypothetical protein